MEALLGLIISWLPMVIILAVWILFMRRSMSRQGGMMQVGRENTAAVQENTAALKALLAKLESQSNL